GPQQRAFHEDRDIERRALREVANVEVAGVTSWRHRAVLAGFGAGDPGRTRKRRQRNLDAGRELGDLTLEIEVKVLDLTLGKAIGKFAEHARHVEVRRISARNDLVDLDLEHHAG